MKSTEHCRHATVLKMSDFEYEVSTENESEVSEIDDCLQEFEFTSESDDSDHDMIENVYHDKNGVICPKK